MFKRKLQALDYPNYENFNISNTQEFRSMVVWMEDQKIRHYKIEQRAGLRDIQSTNWPNAFQEYLQDLACPIASKNNSELMEWLLGYAVRLEYGDNVDKYKGQTAENMKKNQVNAPKIVSTNPLDNLDFESAEFKAGVSSLAQLLNVTKHPDHTVTLQGISRLVKERLSTEAIQNPGEIISNGSPFPFQHADLGFDTGDYVLNQAAKILRLLYIKNLRDLQTRINESIVAVQSVTANPKTDTRIGRVGK